MKYIKEGTGRNVILLHGWGCNKMIFMNIISALKHKYCFWSLDLPGFGESVLTIPLHVEEYAMLLKKFIDDNAIENPYIMGHSFGGRVAINYAANNYCEKLVLVASAGIKRIKPKVIKYKIQRKIYQTLRLKNKIEKLRNRYASSDYKIANDVLKETLKNAVNYDQRKEMRLITSETLLLWGVNDQDTPIKDAILMNKLIYNSALIKFDNVAHYPFIEDKNQFCLVLDAFLGGE